MMYMISVCFKVYTRGWNSCIVDIEINNLSRSFVNLQINLIFIRYLVKWRTRKANQKPGILRSTNQKLRNFAFNQSEAKEFCVQPMRKQRKQGYPKSKDQAVMDIHH